MMRRMFRPRLFAVPIAVLITWGCSSDPDSPLGTEFIDGGTVGSTPGEVFQDTIKIAGGDTSFVTNSVLPFSSTMLVGRRDDNETAMLIRFDIVPDPLDTRQVDRAILSLRVTSSSQTDSINARMFELLQPFSEDSVLHSLNLSAGAVPDPANGNAVDRAMKFAVSSYELPALLVQDWIRGNTTQNGLAVVISDTTTTRQLTYGTRENEGLSPFLRVTFTDLSEVRFLVSDDGTFVTSLSSTTNLIISDGVTRRILLPVDLSSFNSNFLLHDASLTLTMVPGSSTAGDLAVSLYAPLSSDPADSGALTGITVAIAGLDVSSGVLRLPVRAILERFLALPATNHGLALRYSLEGTSIRQIEFFTSADSLGPVLDLTFSEAPRFTP